MKVILPLAAALLLGAAPALAVDDSFSSEPAPAPSRKAADIYSRISAHYGPMGRDVKEKFRDGPCRIERRWWTDGDYEETIKCRGPRDRD
ncbi:hypothetical protein [Hyphomicrobium sp. LHD-15]|uniref:hypothetical protein n=1 Tax=Hyphomicrobium sp. LHD-15 TaxID=3072142 RepID=UPI00280F3331|nr:hypothetical protein [Hyphomicrobium sp. LHD-15]MDQ8698184.1 hypothetical protein [Hyphomicrobium sp. LHD-15]